MTQLQEKISAAKKLFRMIDQALDDMVTMDESSRRITANILRSTNEEIEEQVIKLIKKSHGRNSTTVGADVEGRLQDQHL